MQMLHYHNTPSSNSYSYPSKFYHFFTHWVLQSCCNILVTNIHINLKCFTSYTGYFTLAETILTAPRLHTLGTSLLHQCPTNTSYTQILFSFSFRLHNSNLYQHSMQTFYSYTCLKNIYEH